MRETALKIAGIALIVFAIALFVYAVFGIKLPADYYYNSHFGSRVTMAYDQASFEGTKEQILILWQNMNETFKDRNLNETYNTPWWWQQTYDNSLKAQEDYFVRLNKRIDDQIKEQQDILEGRKQILVPYNQWYQQALENIRTEMKREGGLDWALSGAWYLTFAPSAYWLYWWLIPVEIALWVLGIVMLLIGYEWL